MPESPSVSVLVTVYNREAYLTACLESILESSWDDFEIVLVDDGSTDASPSIGADFATRDSRVRFFQNDHNLGDYPNRMRAAELARGSYIKYVDSDDLIYRHGLATMMEAMKANPHASLGLSHSLPEDDEPYPWALTPVEAWRKEFLGGGCMACGPSGAIIRRDVFSKSGGFRDWGLVNDLDLWYRLSSTHPIVLLQPGLVWWRRHGGQEFTKQNAEILFLKQGHALVVQSLNSASCPLSGDERRVALARANQRHARRILALALRKRRPGEALKLARISGLSGSQMLRGFKSYT